MTDKVLKEGKHPLSDALRALDAGRKNLPGIGGQQCGLESYRIVANGNTLEVLHEAADELDRLNMCLSEEQNEARETVERFRAECDRLKLSLAEVTDRAERAESSFGAATEERERLLEERTEARNAATDLAIALRSKEEYAERLSTDMAEAAMRILQNDEEGVKEWARGLKIDFTAKDGRPRLALETRPEIFTNGPAQAVASSGEAIREGRGNPSGGTEKPSCVYRSGCVAGLGCELEGRCLAPEIERKHGVGPHAEHAPSMVPVFRVEEGCSDLWCVTFDGIAAPYLWSFKDEQTAKNLARELNRLVAPTMKLSSQNPVRPDLSEAGGADRDRTR